MTTTSRLVRWDLASDLHTVVLTTGHSGSKSLAHALQSAGLHASHEGIFRAQGVRPLDAAGWLPAIEIAAGAIFHLPALHAAGVRLLHLVRDPGAVWRSWVQGSHRDMLGDFHHVRLAGGLDLSTYRTVPDRATAWLRYVYDGAMGVPVIRLERPDEIAAAFDLPSITLPHTNRHRPRKAPHLRVPEIVHRWQARYGYQEDMYARRHPHH